MKKVLALLLAAFVVIGMIGFASAASYPGADHEDGDIEVEIGGGGIGAQGKTGDCNGDGKVNSEDVIYLLWHTMFSDGYVLKCNGDFTGDKKVNSDDVIYLLWHCMFPSEYPLT